MNSIPNRAVAISYFILVGVLILAGALHLTSLLVTVLFSCFAIDKLAFSGKKPIAVASFLVAVILVFCGFVFFLHQAFDALPKIVATTIPMVVQFADKHGISLPFTDVQGLKEVAVDTVRKTLGYLGNFAKIATKEFVMLVVGLVVSIGIFLHDEKEESPANATDFYSFYHALITSRFRSFYRSFETVMSAQLLISLINTLATTVFVLTCRLPYAEVIIPLTFVCGLLPIIGNLISNSLIVGVAFGSSPQMAGIAFAFLLIIHKLEYFLNSKIVGSRIRHPMWLTLVALILGECLMGLPGIILAPVILNFIRVEGSKYPAPGHRKAEEEQDRQPHLTC